MLKWLVRLLTHPVYPHPNPDCTDYLTLREMADLPPYHPPRDGIDERKGRR